MNSLWYNDKESLVNEAKNLAAEMFLRGEHPVSVARQIVKDFDRVHSDNRALAYALLAMACHIDDKAAKAAARKAGIKNNHGYTWSEVAYRLFFEDSIELLNFEVYEALSLTTLSAPLGHGIFSDGSVLSGEMRFRKFVNPTQKDCLLDLNIEGHTVYGCRRRNGHLALVYVLPTEQSVLIDEEVFNGEHPLYFTESTHFWSPVCILHTLREIFRFATAKTCFAPIHLDLCLTLPSPKGELINAEDYLADVVADGPSDWKEMDLRVRRGNRSRWLINDLVPLTGRLDDEIDWCLHDYMVLRLFNATAALFNHLPAGKYHSNLTPEALEPLSKYGFL